MIERFNFYDIYGYLLPGTLLFGLFWLPFGLATGGLPANEISTTLLLLVFAYIAGHLLQTVAMVLMPSTIPDGKGELRTRSNILLDADNPRFSASFKADLAEKVKKAFHAEILGEDAQRRADRDAAFFAARAYLIRNKAANYVEQFEGLYAMMRGLGCAFYLGCAYLAGWGLSFHWKVVGLGLGMWGAFGRISWGGVERHRDREADRGASGDRQGQANAAAEECDQGDPMAGGLRLIDAGLCGVFSRDVEAGSGAH